MRTVEKDTIKSSFLVYRQNKYFPIPVDTIAFFYVKFTASVMVCFNREEYSINDSLDHIQNRLPDLKFFRVNRQFLVNFNAVKEVEHYFARKLLVSLMIPAAEKVLVPREKASAFLRWLENR
ncbi:LytTR family DNA-binding domain-containing protein [Puia sp.]|jgi:DNA-binding LytR/AlgR family response regulator|uniref:LytR/AlgR family response regulator transcription factor n=1 Tax=Puia sp. TaxID=2045100 RepID=UPI002F42395A